MASITAQVCGNIRDGKYAEAIDLLQRKLGEHPNTRSSRGPLSLIAYCCYQQQEFARAAEFYERLTELYPESEDYKVSYAQCLVKCGSHADASRVAASAVESCSSNEHTQRLLLLKAQAELEQGMASSCSSTLSSTSLDEDNPERILALAALEYREGRFAKALETYKIARQVLGDEPILAYGIALCHYQLSQQDAALELVAEIIGDAGEEEKEDRSTESFLAEALNLKAAILHTTKRIDAAKEAMKELCELKEDENLDIVILHNDALINMDQDPSVAMQKLEYLLANQPFPPETLSNLLTLYTSNGQDSLAAETFESNKGLAQELLPSDIYAYYDAILLSLTCPGEALAKLERLTAQHAPKLRHGKKDITAKSAFAGPAASRGSTASARPTTAAERKGHRALAAATKDFEGVLDQYIPMLMLQARLYWDKKEYSKAQQLLEKSADFCQDHDAWRMNMGHILFAQQGDKFKRSIDHYEHLLKTQVEADLLKVPPVALANLCVSYVMTNQNDAAEALIKKVEREEQQQMALGNGERTFHSCIINLVIGTLYCERGQFDFGISRVCKSMEPFEKNLTQDTWFYTKRCFLALASKISKMMYLIDTGARQDILQFFEDVESNGKHIIVESEAENSDPLNPKEPSTVATEAKSLKEMFLKICP